MDPDTAAWIVQLLIEDISKALEPSARKGKGREGVLSDAQIALQLQREDLERIVSIIADRQIKK
jgi:hypothetical protein